MARPRSDHPTPAELEVLHVLWDRGEATVRDVQEALDRRRPRAYTSVMSLLNVMTEKGLLRRTPRGKAFVYAARVGARKTLAGLLKDVLQRGFRGSASLLLAHLLDEARPGREEIEEIRRTIEEYREHRKEKGGGR